MVTDTPVSPADPGLDQRRVGAPQPLCDGTSTVRLTTIPGSARTVS